MASAQAEKPKDERPPLRDVEAPLGDPIGMPSSPGAGCSSDPQEVQPLLRDAPAQLVRECFSVPQLKERALKMFVVLSGDAP